MIVGGLVQTLGGTGITLVLLVLAISIGLHYRKGEHHKGVMAVVGGLLVIMMAALAVNLAARNVLGAWMVNQLTSTL